MLRVENLSVHFPVYRGLMRRQQGTVRAVDNVSLAVSAGSTLGLVGESGCGKTTAGRAILRLYKATSGKIVLDGQDITLLKGDALRRIRPKMQMIFQDPQACLNPRMTVGSIIAEPLLESVQGRRLGARGRRDKVNELLDAVGLPPAYANRYPHEFSGGQRQRIGIARALAMSPALIVCDEPIAALDVSIQAQVVNLLLDLQAQYGLTYVFISHDLAMVRHIAAQVAVMYLGRIVESGDCHQLYRNPRHPYTRALLSALPIPDPQRESQRERILLHGDVPSPLNPPPGCAFSTRCPHAQERCRLQTPPGEQLPDGRFIACHRVAELG